VSDWYRNDTFAQLAASGGVARNPGPDEPFDPAGWRKSASIAGARSSVRISTARYMIGTRGKGEISTGSGHLGFRCVGRP
jgi:hypothetical protein